MIKKYVLYHYPCKDGLGAKYAAWKKFGNEAIYIPVNYGYPLPEMDSGSEVYILDFSYPRDVLRSLITRMVFLQVLDHHKTAEAALQGEYYAKFDMNKSGAVMAWEHFHPNTPVPSLLLHIQDRDIWTWKLDNTKEVLNFLDIQGEDVSKWDDLVNVNIDALKQGRAISLYQDKYLENQVRNGQVKITEFQGYKVAVVNSTTLISEIGSKLCEDFDIDFAIVWNVNLKGLVYVSLRSIGDFDVTPIAVNLGGGGHKNASGAKVNLDWIKQLYE